MSADRTASLPRAAQGGPATDRHDVRRRVWAIVGGSSATWSSGTHQAGHESRFYWYVTVMCVISLVAAITMPDTRRAGMLLAHEGRLVEAGD